VTVNPPEYRTRLCRSCEAPIIWAVTEKGKPIAIDVKPATDGNVLLIGSVHNPVAHVLANGTAQDSTTVRYRSHWASCPHAASWRKR
jgi:hypothetical protein